MVYKQETFAKTILQNNSRLKNPNPVVLMSSFKNQTLTVNNCEAIMIYSQIRQSSLSTFKIVIHSKILNESVSIISEYDWEFS